MRALSQIGIALLIVSSFSLATAQEKPGIPLFRAFGAIAKAKKAKASQPAPEPIAMPTNSLSAPHHAITPTGGRLKPFGEPQYWGNTPPPPTEATVVNLPPMPDLRTPDQVSKLEKKRNIQQAKFALRQNKSAAVKQALAQKEIAEKIKAEQRNLDPNAALIQAQSQANCAVDTGKRERPLTTTGGQLKPFNASSRYAKDGQLLYQHNNTVFEEPATAAPSSNEPFVANLQPIPDLRTPDQVSKLERKRNAKIQKFKERQAREDALRAGPAPETGLLPLY